MSYSFHSGIDQFLMIHRIEEGSEVGIHNPIITVLDRTVYNLDRRKAAQFLAETVTPLEANDLLLGKWLSCES